MASAFLAEVRRSRRVVTAENFLSVARFDIDIYFLVVEKAMNATCRQIQTQGFLDDLDWSDNIVIGLSGLVKRIILHAVRVLEFV
jgi:predicted DNA-binding transcriptional regulator